MAWTNDTIIEFLNLYKNEQILWDPKNPLHRNRGKINAAWDRIQTSLSIDVSIPELKKKKESLMTSYRMHWNKKKKTLGNYHTTWFAYPYMESFLTLRYECDSTSQMDSEHCVNTTNSQQKISSNDQLVNRKRKCNYVERRNSLTSAPTDDEHGAYNKTSKTRNSSHSYSKKRPTEDVRTSKDFERDVDEYDLYGQLLAKKLRQLKEHQRDVAMHEINNIMFKVKMESNACQNREARSITPLSPSPVLQKTKPAVFLEMESSYAHYKNENASYGHYAQREPS